MKAITVALLTACLACRPSFAADDPNYPEWWKTRQVIILSADPGNKSPINQGQLLWLAENAIAELNHKLAPIGGAGFDLTAFRDSQRQPAYYSPANLGQLKNVAHLIL